MLIRKQITISVMLIFTLWLSSCSNIDDTQMFSGEGTKSNPYKITSSEDLKNLSDLLTIKTWSEGYANAYYVQTADIDLSGIIWNPIGADINTININTNSPGAQYGYAFGGHYDGTGHIIKNMNILVSGNNKKQESETRNVSSAIGLFGRIMYMNNKDVGVENVKLENCTIDYDDKLLTHPFSFVGTLVGVLGSEDDDQVYETIVNCEITNSSLNAIPANVGLFVGQNNGQIKNCKSTGEIHYELSNDGFILGGFVGENRNLIDKCKSECKMYLDTTDKEESDEYHLSPLSPSTDMAFAEIGGFAGRNGELNDAEESIYNAVIKKCNSSGTFIFENAKLYEDSFIGVFAGINEGQIKKCTSDINDEFNGKTINFTGSESGN